MTSRPLVTVTVPCLNRARYLPPTLESILSQDYPNIECIVVDGGSTDGTVDILQRYGERIRWVSEADRGHSDAINKGWRLGRGEILAWLNADDVWEIPSGVRHAVDYLESHPEVDLVYGSCGAIDADGGRCGMSYHREWDLEQAVLDCDHCIPQPAAFMRRRIVERVGWLDLGFHSKKDHELWLRIGLHGTIRFLPALLAHARTSPGYMDTRGDITAAACVRLTQKFFRQPAAPDAIVSRRRRALSNAHLRGVEYAWAYGRHWSSVLRHWANAIAIDPSNSRNAARRLRECLTRQNRSS